MLGPLQPSVQWKVSRSQIDRVDTLVLMIDVRRLEVLVAVARSGSVSRAAEALHYGQPTVSHHLRRLEAETGAVLLQRVGRGIRLTADGERLAARGEEILALLDRAETELRAATSLEHGVVRLATFPSAVPTLVPRLLEDLAGTHPGIRLELLEAEPPEAIAMLVSGRVDLALAFTYSGHEAPAAVTAEVLGHDPLLLVTRAGEGGDRLEDHAGERWLAGCERCRSHLVDACRQAGFEPDIAFASDDYVAVQALVAAGAGTTLLPALALAAHHHPGIEARPVVGATRELVLLTHGRPPLPPGLRAVSDAVRRSVGVHMSDAAAGTTYP